jgi:hypothetical protein
VDNFVDRIKKKTPKARGVGLACSMPEKRANIKPVIKQQVKNSYSIFTFIF